ncbi:hypothetical protein HQQ81_07610 [Microbacteriaceae bacterium VKM Ac-2854]|nr:hypothetical protein [Microbacteriaceae bacterium VKM Ac-2854]
MTLRDSLPAHDSPGSSPAHHSPGLFPAPTRRSLVQAGAWTIPAVGIAIAAPVASASGPDSYDLRPFASGDGHVGIKMPNPLNVRVLNLLGTPFTGTMVLTVTVAATYSANVYIIPSGSALNPTAASASQGWGTGTIVANTVMTFPWSGTIAGNGAVSFELDGSANSQWTPTLIGSGTPLPFSDVIEYSIATTPGDIVANNVTTSSESWF